MITANELRIGNWVEANSPPMIVRSINEYDVELEFPPAQADNWTEPVDSLNGIPVTGKILLKSGFQLNKHNSLGEVWESYEFNGFTIHNRYAHFCYEGLNEKFGIYHVHQLQNFYFALKGIELKIEL